MNSNISISLSLPQLLQACSRFFHRYHVIIFSCIVLGGLSAATFMLYQTITSTQPTDSAASASAFDQQTIEKIKSLHSASDASEPLVFPAGRTNPFK